MRIVRRWILGSWAAIVLAWGPAVRAESGVVYTEPLAGPEFACLTRVDQAKVPAYPAAALALHESEFVRLRLSFVDPDEPPKVEVLRGQSEKGFIATASKFARAYRLPCLAKGAAPVVGTQEFDFQPNDGRKVMSGRLADVPQSLKAVSCLVIPEGHPDYRQPVGRIPEGTVVLRLTFRDGVSPPEAKVVFDGGSPDLTKSALAYATGYRMPCVGSDLKAPVDAYQSFDFFMADTRRYALKDSTLQQFASMIDRADRNAVRFDFTTMSCPFDLRFRLFRPHAPNEIGEVEHVNPNRREFIDWLKTVTLKLPPDAAKQVIGQQMTISVPCTVLDLS